MVRGIYLANIIYTDKKHSKVRPVLILKQNSYNDLVYLPLTTNLEAKGILIDNDVLDIGRIPKKSIVITEKISVIDKSLLLRKIATINNIQFNIIISEICNFLKN